MAVVGLYLFPWVEAVFIGTACRYARFYTPNELEALLKNAGFEEVESAGVILFPSFWPFIGLAEKADRKCYKRCKNIAAFIAVRGVKG